MPILIADIARTFPSRTRELLTRAEYRWEICFTRKEALARAPFASILVVTSASPDPGARALIHSLRSQSEAPLIALLRHHVSAESVRLFRAGADDVVVVSNSFAEFQARIEALRRRVPAPPLYLVVGEVEHSLRTQRAFHRGADLQLTPTEFTLLRSLATHPGRELPRQTVAAAIWPGGHPAHSRALDVHLAQARKKVPMLSITTLRGYGYRLEIPRRSAPPQGCACSSSGNSGE